MMQKVEIKVAEARWQVRITVEDISGRQAVSEHALALLERQVPRALEALA